MLELAAPLQDLTVLADGAVNTAASALNETYQPDVHWTVDMMHVSGSFVVTEPRNDNIWKLQDDSNEHFGHYRSNSTSSEHRISLERSVTLKRKVARSDRMISSLKEEVKSLRGKTICSDREISSLKGEVARSDCENIRFRAEHPASDREMSSLWGKVQDLKQEVCNVTNALGQLQLVMSSLMPVQRHKLLESATKKITNLTGKDWDPQMPRKTIRHIYRDLQSKFMCHYLSQDALNFLADHSTIQNEGNVAAHNATAGDIWMAFTMDPYFSVDDHTRAIHENLFAFVYQQPLHQHVAN